MKKLFTLAALVLLTSAIMKAQQETKTIRLKVIETSDVHGHFFPHDFMENRPLTGTLSRASTYIGQQRQQYGDRLLLHGGINAVLWSDKDAIVAEIEKNVPILKENGGYIFSSDHSIPNAVSLENFRIISDTVKRVGRY